MDFEELKNESHNQNVRKNRATLIALFVIFFTPVLIAYSAYFTGWFTQAAVNRGTLLIDSGILDVEDFEITLNDKIIAGAEFETLYWWLMPIDPNHCDQACVDLNIYLLNQTYVGLGKESKRLKPLLIAPNTIQVKPSQNELQNFPIGYAEFTTQGLKPKDQTASGLNRELPSNYIYLADPLGNIILRYPIARQKEDAPKISEDLRKDVTRLFKYSRLG